MIHLLYTFLFFSILILSGNSSNISSSSDSEPDTNTLCNQVYENQHSSWLPPHYAHNANCACKAIPSNSPEGACIRNFLINRLNDDKRYNSDFKDQMSALKSSDKGNENLDKDFIEREFLPKIQQDHFDAYKKCGCEGTPAGWWAWEMVTKVSLPCSVIKVGIMVLESCHKTPDRLEASEVKSVEAGLRGTVNEGIQNDKVTLSNNETEEEDQKQYKEFMIMLELLGALIFSLIVIYSAAMYCKQRKVRKLEKDCDNGDNEYYRYYHQAILYID